MQGAGPNHRRVSFPSQSLLGLCSHISHRRSNDDKYKHVHFTKVDVDELPELAQEMSVRAMPTVILFKDGKKVDTVLSPTPNGLVELLEKGSGA